MTEKNLSLFLENNIVDNDAIVLLHEMLPYSNDLFFLNEHSIREMPRLDSAVVIVLKRAIYFKNEWVVRFLPSHDVKYNGVSLLEGEEVVLEEGAKVTVYENEFSLLLGKESLLSQSEKNQSPDISSVEPEQPKFIANLKYDVLMQHNLNGNNDVADFNNEDVLQDDFVFPYEAEGDILDEGNLLDIISVGEYFKGSLGSNADVLKELENEYERVLIDPHILVDKKIDQTFLKNKETLKSDDYFLQGQLIAEESTEELVDGRLGIDEIEQLLGADFNNELFKIQGNDDILLLYASMQQKDSYRKPLPSANKKDFYAVTLRTLLSDVNFQTESVCENSEEEIDHDTRKSEY